MQNPLREVQGPFCRENFIILGVHGYVSGRKALWVTNRHSASMFEQHVKCMRQTSLFHCVTGPIE